MNNEAVQKWNDAVATFHTEEFADTVSRHSSPSGFARSVMEQPSVVLATQVLNENQDMRDIAQEALHAMSRLVPEPGAANPRDVAIATLLLILELVDRERGLHAAQAAVTAPRTWYARKIALEMIDSQGHLVPGAGTSPLESLIEHIKDSYQAADVHLNWERVQADPVRDIQTLNEITLTHQGRDIVLRTDRRGNAHVGYANRANPWPQDSALTREEQEAVGWYVRLRTSSRRDNA